MVAIIIVAGPQHVKGAAQRSEDFIGMKKDVGLLMEEIRTNLQILESSLPKHVDGWALSQLSRLPFKVMVYRESLAWRMAELARAAFEKFEQDKLAAGIVLTRSAVETSAALWYLRGKVEACVESGEVGDIDEYLMKMTVGMATDPPLDETTSKRLMPRPVKVGKFLDAVEKDIEGFNQQYGYLSEYAHPNWAGTVFLYSKLDKKRGTADFGANLRGQGNTKNIGVNNLSVVLLMFERAYNAVAELIPAFTEICENRLKASAAT
jgi:hypothetical protein